MKTQKYTAVFKDDHFKHFGIHPSTASLYGDKKEDILDVIITEVENQKRPPANDTDMSPDYWAWWDNEQSRFTLVYPKFFLLDICFPAGIKATEKHGEGKAYRVNVEVNTVK